MLSKSEYLRIVFVLALFAIVAFFFSPEADSPTVENILDSQLEIKKDSLIDTVFIPVSNQNLLMKATPVLTPEAKIFLANRIREYENKLSFFTDSTSLIDRVNAYFMLSADYRTLGEYDKAKEFLEKALTLDPKNSNLMQVYSSLLSAMGDNVSALLYINKAIALYGLESNYWLWKIDLEQARGVSDERIERVYKNALEATGTDLNIVTAYARFLEGEGRYQEAIARWKEATRIYPVNKEIYQQEINRLQSLK